MTSPAAATPGQTVGPFFHYALPFAGGDELVPADAPDAIALQGRVLDGADNPVPEALIELWQAAADGSVPRAAGSLTRAGHPDTDFTGWGRAATDAEGRYRFTTLAPGAPFFAVTVFARGLLNRLFTRAYLPEHAADPFLAGLEPARRDTLLTVRDAHDPRILHFDIRLQGASETVFLAFPADPRH